MEESEQKAVNMRRSETIQFSTKAQFKKSRTESNIVVYAFAYICTYI